jgi:hypothetical protein
LDESPQTETEIEIEEISTEQIENFTENSKFPDLALDSEFPSRINRSSTPKQSESVENGQNSFKIEPNQTEKETNKETEKKKKIKNEKIITNKSETKKDTYKQKIIDTIMAR